MELDYLERETLTYQIISGVVPVELNGEVLFVHEPTPIDKVLADRLYKKELRAAELSGIWSTDEMIGYKKKNRLWSDAEQEELSNFPKRIEQLKIELYEAYFQYKKRDGIKKMLEETRLRECTVTKKIEEWKPTTSEGYALNCKLRYLISTSIKDESGNKKFTLSYERYKQEDIDDVLNSYYQARIDETTIRYLARSEPWRSIYAAGKAQGGVNLNHISLLTFEQRSILLWSKIYDSIYERGSECPPENVINDDDCFDGWMILESRKSEKERNANSGYKPGDKFAKADEVFIPVDNIEDIQRVNSMNSMGAQIRKQQRFNAINKAGGKISDQHLPDSQDKIREIMMRNTNNGKK